MVSNIVPSIHLPLPISSFIGRETELKALQQKLAAGARLITLVGPGGVGKTRLALELCALEAASFMDGAAFVTLEAIADAEFILPEIARGLSVELSGTASPLDDLISSLKEKQLLLCVDNWEHLIEAGGQVIPLLAACPTLSLLATSREPLRLRGEQVISVEPLKLPPANSTTRPEAVTGSQAVQLFVERARAVRPGFELDQKNTAPILDICTLLDGLPLAVELAAALMRMFSPEALLARMKKSGSFADRTRAVDMLVGGPRDLPARQQTMRSTIEWSYGLLDPDEQRVFRRLAVFAGGCDLEAAEAVCQTDSQSARPILDILIVLVDKSMFQVKEVDGEPRFTVLRTIHDYALTRLEEEGESDETERKHANYYLEFAKRAQPKLKEHDSALWFKRLNQEQDNLRLALSWGQRSGNHKYTAKLATALTYYWYIRGYTHEGIRTLEDLLKTTPDNFEPHLHIQLLRGAGMMSIGQGEYLKAQNYFESALSFARQIEDWESAQRALGNLGIIADSLGDFAAARSYYLQSLDLAHQLENTSAIATSLLNLGTVAFAQGDQAEAKAYFLECLPLMEELGDPNGIAIAVGNLGRLASYAGVYKSAKPYLLRSLTIAKEIGEARTIASVLDELALVSLREGDMQAAASYFRQSLLQSQALAEKSVILEVLRSFVEFEVKYGHLARAIQLWGFEKKERELLGVTLSPYAQTNSDRIWAEVRQKFNSKEIDGVLQLGHGMTFEEAVTFALDSPALRDKPSKSTKQHNNPADLTRREVEVLRLVAEGLSDKEIAETLVLSPRTVNAHLTSIYSKIGVNSRVAATRFAIENSLTV